MRLSPERIENFSRRVNDRFKTADIRVPEANESEPSFTRSVLADLVRTELSELQELPLTFRGDGATASALPASALGIDFFPDLAVSIGDQNIWAAEVKLLRIANRQSAIATAIGQAHIYLTRYSRVSVVLIDSAPTRDSVQEGLAGRISTDKVTVIVRPLIAQRLAKHAT